jgi:hypothetical protein
MVELTTTPGEGGTAHRAGAAVASIDITQRPSCIWIAAIVLPQFRRALSAVRCQRSRSKGEPPPCSSACKTRSTAVSYS